MQANKIKQHLIKNLFFFFSLSLNSKLNVNELQSTQNSLKKKILLYRYIKIYFKCFKIIIYTNKQNMISSYIYIDLLIIKYILNRIINMLEEFYFNYFNYMEL